ncbi:MAG: hypothetical protein R2880_08560 [Deinococcales bacterium]
MIIPQAFKERMLRQLGLSESEKLFESLKAPPQSSLRLHPYKGKHLLAEMLARYEAIAWHPEAFYLDERPSFVADPHFHAGAYYVQEASSMLLYQAFEPRAGQVILDLCAAPGGKSTLLASAMAEGSLLIANEVVAKRASVLQETVGRWGEVGVVVCSSPPSHFARLKNSIDVLVIDAPCSGEGMFRKDDEALAQWSPDLIQSCALRQRQILVEVLPALKAGGTLIYSTCSYAPEEDEEIVTWLCEQGLEPHPLNLSTFGAYPVTIAKVSEAAHYCYPHRLKGEGFFIARLRKPRQPLAKGDQSLFDSKKASKPLAEQPYHDLVKDYLAQDYLESLRDFELVSHQQNLYLRPKVSDVLAKTHIRILQSGLELGKYLPKQHKAPEFRPSHQLAMSRGLNKDVEAYELSYEEAIAYLSKEELDHPPPQSFKTHPWLLARYQGSNLGWLKASQTRMNTYYPSNWRIRQKLS